ncbi:large-conductance mechanosensitive channel [Fusobacterium sp. PH5-7]|nr:large-conductance mechanosensitive channel [Fusobacterium sp. PH5-7]
MKEIVMIIAVGVFIGIAVAGIVLYLITKFVDTWEGK